MAKREALRELQSRLAERMQAARAQPAAQAWLAVECRGTGLLFPLAQAGEIFALAPLLPVLPTKDLRSTAQVDFLTARERETLAHIATGKSNDEIARQMEISLNSVKSYIRSAYRKLGVTRRSQAVIWGFQHGLLEDEGDAA